MLIVLFRLDRLQSYGFYQKFMMNEMFFVEKDLAEAEEANSNQIEYIGMADLDRVVVYFFTMLGFSFLLNIVENMAASGWIF